MRTKSELDQVLDRLRRHGGRVTTTRRAIVQAILDGGDHHISALDLTERLRSSYPDLAPSTVYRTLDALCEVGVIEHTHLGHGAAVFHLADYQHAHIVCHVCGVLAQADDRWFAELRRYLADDLGFELTPEHVALSGRCPRCVARAAGREAVTPNGR